MYVSTSSKQGTPARGTTRWERSNRLLQQHCERFHGTTEQGTYEKGIPVKKHLV
jgi:hypothetical protein